MIQSAHDNPFKWFGTFFGCIVAGVAAWPYLLDVEPIVRIRMEQYFQEQITPFVGLTSKLYLGSLYQRCDKTLSELKTATDKTQIDRRLRHLDSEIKLAEQKAHTNEYGGCQQ